MKRTAMFHRKLGKLTARLGSKCMAVGVLESLWHLTAREFPQGNVGKISDEDICVEIGYPGDPKKLIDDLCETGWLDRCPKYRLLVHGWEEHCDQSVTRQLTRSKLPFLVVTSHVQPELAMSNTVEVRAGLPCLALPSHSQAIATPDGEVVVVPSGMIDRTEMIQTLANECSFPPQQAIKLAGDPWLTPERLRFIITRAGEVCGKDGIQGFIVSGIKGKWVPDPTKGQTIAKPAYVPSREGAW